MISAAALRAGEKAHSASSLQGIQQYSHNTHVILASGHLGYDLSQNRAGKVPFAIPARELRRAQREVIEKSELGETDFLGLSVFSLRTVSFSGHF